MKIFTDALVNYSAGNLWSSDIPFVTYYSDIHIQYGTTTAMMAKPITAALHVELATEQYLSANDKGGNNSPLTIVSPEYAPYPFAGNCVVAYVTTSQGGVSVAEEEMEDDFEYIEIYNTTSGNVIGYLIWGSFKVTQTEFYTPKLMGSITTVRSWNPIEGLDHASLDYSEKIAQVVDSPSN